MSEDDVTVYETKHQAPEADTPRTEALRVIARKVSEWREWARDYAEDGYGEQARFKDEVSKELQRAQDHLAEPGPKETQTSITAWADETFGSATSNMRIAVRALEEMVELLKALDVGASQLVTGLIEVIADRASLLRSVTVDLVDFHATGAKAGEEAADVVIVLQRLFSRLSVDGWREVERKMAVNRARVWRVDGSGHGYHVRAEEAAKP